MESRADLNVPDLVKGLACEGLAYKYRDEKSWGMGGQPVFAWGHVY